MVFTNPFTLCDGNQFVEMMNISNASEPKYELFFLVMINNSINIIHNVGMSIYWDGTICFRRGGVHKSWWYQNKN